MKMILNKALFVLLPVGLVAACSVPGAPGVDDPLPVSDVVEVAAHEQRLAITHDAGILVLTAASGVVEADIPTEGFVRLSDAGDGRHVVVSAAGGFRTLDLGSWTERHGDHGHSWTSAPGWGGVVVPAEVPGHVVAHRGRLTLFDDGSGTITSIAGTDLEGESGRGLRSWASEVAHHGVAVELPDGTLLRTLAEGTERVGVVHATAMGGEITRSEDCPGLHGEAVADGAVVFGCADGALVFRDGLFTKISAAADYARSGNLAGSEESHVVLADLKSDAQAELERPSVVALFDTVAAEVRLVDLPASYSFRSLGRGPGGEALVLGTDGALRAIDPISGRVLAEIAVVAPWEEPVDWREPRPTLEVVGVTAYVTEPQTLSLHVVDLEHRRVTASHELPQVPNEVVGAISGLDP